MKYKVERFKDEEHEEGNLRDKARFRPYTVREVRAVDQEALILQLRQERENAKESGVYRITPMDEPFRIGIDVHLSVVSRLIS